MADDSDATLYPHGMRSLSPGGAINRQPTAVTACQAGTTCLLSQVLTETHVDDKSVELSPVSWLLYINCG
jgi:hypothetical protein